MLAGALAVAFLILLVGFDFLAMFADMVPAFLRSRRKGLMLAGMVAFYVAAHALEFWLTARR